MRKRVLAIIISVGAGLLIYGLMNFQAAMVDEVIRWFSPNSEFLSTSWPWSWRYADYLGAVGAALTIWASLEYWRN
jgi:hypothetical protein